MARSPYKVTLTSEQQALQQYLAAQQAAEQAQLQQAIQNAIVRFGEAPEGYSHEALSPEVTALAQQNTDAGLSLVARLNQQKDLGQRGIMNDLAGRGMLQSGETGYQLGQLGLGYRQQQYDARQELLDYLGGVQSAFAQNQTNREYQLGQGILESQQTQAGQPWNYGGYSGGSGGGGAPAPAPAASPDLGDLDGGAPLTPQAPNNWQLKVMGNWVSKAGKHRPDNVRNLFRTFEEWRKANPEWWK